MTNTSRWENYKAHLFHDASLGFSLDISRMDLPQGFLASFQTRVDRAIQDMRALEGGAISNPDEKRMVGHYWLRNAQLAPSQELRSAISDALHKLHRFVADVDGGRIAPERGGRFTHVLVVGIGGSALGPQFVADALGTARDTRQVHFLDNTDPDGMDRVLQGLGDQLANTLTLVISKSGGTKETRNGMVEARAAYASQGLNFARHAVAVTGDGSELDTLATKDGWLDRFPMWDWVGGRTSELATVGLLPAALQGIDVDQLLSGARDMDILTREEDARRNPALLLALVWHHATNGKGEKDMVVLPYKDRLLLLSRYLQQLVMESLGKEKDLQGNTVHQGIAVYGNKGSTDQHAYVQQLRDGVKNHFVTFIQVLKDRAGSSMEVDPGVTSGDYLFGFLQGTRAALSEGGRQSITITVEDVTPRTVGALVALYERAVGFYASLVNINAYHQPGVEAGKKAAATVLELQRSVVAAVNRASTALTVEEAAQAAGSQDVEMVALILAHLGANGRLVRRVSGSSPVDARYAAV